MADRLVKECDVYGDVRNVKDYTIAIEEIVPNGDDVTVLSTSIDLGNRGLTRLLKCIQRGTHPPKWKPTDGAE